MDVLLKALLRRRFDLEMQKRRVLKKSYLEKRSRYYLSGMDRDSLEAGMGYEELGSSYVIFICDFDYYGRGLAVYRRRMSMEDTEDIPYDDGAYVYFLNTRYTIPNAPKEILEFLDYLRTGQVPENCGKLVSYVDARVRQVRYDETKEKSYMTLQMYINDERTIAREEGREEGREEERVRLLYQLYRSGMLTEEQALQMSGMTPDRFYTILHQIEAQSNGEQT